MILVFYIPILFNNNNIIFKAIKYKYFENNI